MPKYRLTNKAVEDLNGIWEYTFEKWSESQADKYYYMLLDVCQEIAENPELGKNYEGIKSDLFGIKANRHVIFYRNTDNYPIEITRILHGQMDLKNRLVE
jgi:toxin ParE1/3/4